MSDSHTQASPADAHWQEDFDFRQRPPKSSASDHSEHSFHTRSKSSAHTHSPKRLSVFSGRSRSNTTTSSTSIRRSPASPTASPEAPMPALGDEYLPPGLGGVPVEKQEKAAKSLLMRGSRILRRQGSKFNIGATLDEEDEVGKVASKFEVADFFRGHKSRQIESHEFLKRTISTPYDFHHLTHTNSGQFRTLENASNYELVDEFSAIQASQMPEPELKGIRAADLLSMNTSVEDLADTTNETAWNRQPRPEFVSPPVSPIASPRSPGKVENFSRPVSRMNKVLPPTPTVEPPPRLSSKQAISDIPQPTSQAIDELLGLNTGPTMPDYVYSFTDDATGETSSLHQIDLAGMLRSGVGHALPLTDDDSKLASAVINSYLSELEDVPEEDETHAHQPLRSVSPSIYEEDHTPPTTTSRHWEQARRNSVLITQSSPRFFSDEIMSPTIPEFPRTLQNSPMSRNGAVKKRQDGDDGASTFENMPPSWDEDIDYCYEHAAESNCDFDWNRSSLEIPRVSVSDASEPGKTLNRGPPNVTSVLSPPSLYHLRTASSAPATPGLVPGSSQSVLTRSHDAITPLSEGATSAAVFTGQTANHNDYFKSIGPQYLGPADTNNMGHETMYDEFLVTGDDSDRQFQFFAQGGSQSVDTPPSPRDSYSPISKYNSQESMILSRAASIVRKHRSSTSTTSVPELVPSASSSRENTIRESIESLEHGALGPISDPSRPVFVPFHRQAKSLAPEISSMASLRATRSSGSIDVIDLPSPVASPTHDRTKSASAVEQDHNPQAQRGEGLPFAARKRSSSLAQRRKSRTAYSVFPAGVTASSRR